METQTPKNKDIFEEIENITYCGTLNEVQKLAINEILEEVGDPWDAATSICDLLEIGYRGNRRPIALMLDNQNPPECTK